jgi:hypothetical protein
MSRGIFCGLAAALASALLFCAAEAKAADSDVSADILYYDIFVRANPDGIALRSGVSRRWGYAAGDDPDDKSSYLQSGLSLTLSPSFAQIGAHVEWMPALFMIAHLQYDHYRYFGQYGALLSFPSGDSPFGDDVIDAREGDEEKSYGHRFMFRPTLRGKFGRLLLVNETDISYFLIEGEGPYFRDTQYDTLIKDDDVVFDNKTMLLFEIREGKGPSSFYAGPFYSVTHAASANLTRQRLGIIASLVPVDGLWFFGRPKIYSALGYNVEDRNREGEVFFLFHVGFDIALGGQR